MTKYPPYVNSYGNVGNLFSEIKKASVPPKFTQDFLSTMLGLKSSSYRAMIPLLKRLGFIDQGNVPTQLYKDYRDDAQSKGVMASSLKKAYADLFAASEYAYKLTKLQLSGKLKTITGASEDDKVIPAIASTFMELSKLADFEVSPNKKQGEIVDTQVQTNDSQEKIENPQPMPKNLGISYTST